MCKFAYIINSGYTNTEVIKRGTMAQSTNKKTTPKATKSEKNTEKKTTEAKDTSKVQAVKAKMTRKRLIYAACAVVAILFGLLVWQYLKARSDLKRQQNPAVAIKEEGQDAQAEVGKIMILPKETPTVANISDISKLKDRVFFANAENGDKVLIYKEAKKAIIYRPSTKQIVEVATYNTGQEPAPQANQ